MTNEYNVKSPHAWGCSVSFCAQNRLSKTSGHGKRLIVEIDLTHKEHSHDYPNQAQIEALIGGGHDPVS